jgi:NAD+ diphosphatase
MFHPDNKPPASDAGLHIVFQAGQLITDMRSATPCLIAQEDFEVNRWQTANRHFLGYWSDQPCFASALTSETELDAMRYQRGSLYHILGRVDDVLFALAGRAAQVLDWERDHQFCGRCAQPMEVDQQERAMRCAPCKIMNYPRIAPCVIVLVTRGEEMLLARNVNFPGQMYSTLAGFIEAGESAEDTLIREVKEEVGVDVHNLRYFQSQSWPFPNQLMLGFFAEYAGGDIVCDPSEIADAQWFHYRDMPQTPPPSSISGQLIQHYMQSLN